MTSNRNFRLFCAELAGDCDRPSLLHGLFARQVPAMQAREELASMAAGGIRLFKDPGQKPGAKRRVLTLDAVRRGLAQAMIDYARACIAGRLEPAARQYLAEVRDCCEDQLKA